MKLFYSKGACSLAVRIVINEMGLKCDYEAVNLKTKKTEHDADYLKINPKGAVPALEIKANEVLTENAIIQQYLVDTHEATHLLPKMGDFNRYRTLEVLNYITTEVHKGFGPLFNSNIPAEVKQDIFIPMLNAKFAYLNKLLADKKYIMGHDFTLPDAYLFVMLFWAEGMKIDISANAGLVKYYGMLKQQKSIVKSMQEEGLLERIAG